MKARFLKVSPIGDVPPTELPVKAVGPAVAFYKAVLGFDLTSRSGNSAMLKRDEVTIGLVESKADPEQVSCYFSVDNVETLHAELTEKGIEPSEMRIDNFGGKKFKVFFAKEPYGVCFCFGCEV